MIFSLLKLPKKTAAAISGILIAAASLWGIALWQDLTAQQLLSLVFGSLLFLLVTMLSSALLVLLVKLLGRLVKKLFNRETAD